MLNTSQPRTTALRLIVIASAMALVSCAKNEEPNRPTGYGVASQSKPKKKPPLATKNPPAKKTPAPGGETFAPQRVAIKYFEAAKLGDLSSIRQLVDEKCHRSKVGRVDATRMLNSRMVVESVTTRVKEKKGDRVLLSFEVKGHLDPAKAKKTEVDINGKTIAVKRPSFAMQGITKTGTLKMIRKDGKWLFTCGK